MRTIMSPFKNGFVSGKQFCFALLVCLACFTSARAAVETANNRITGTAIVTGASVEAFDNKYSFMQANPTTWHTTFRVADGVGRIRVSFDHSSLSYVSTAYDYNFYLKIQYQDTNISTPQTVYRQLRAAYDPAAAASYQDAGIYEVNNVDVVWIKVTIDSIRNNITSAFVSSVANNMFVEASTQVERYYQLDYVTVPSTGTLFYTSPGASDEIRVAWNYIDGAEEYDLEWTYVNDYNSTGGTIPASSLSYDFTHNSTRITTSNQHYTIPMLFDRGWLLFRIRAVGRAFDVASGQWKHVYGKWSSDGVGSSGTVSAINTAHRYNITAGHEKRKNWQYSGTFAEEGKKKEVISYFDGSLRNRQTVTKTSTEKKVLVGETFYDFQGRASVTALPAPVLGVSDAPIKYYDGFNLNDSTSTAQKTYNRYDFDVDGGSCAAPVRPMGTAAGASLYYSSSNPEIQEWQAYLPDAKKYPFAQVEYMPDNTGRIRRQGGVGPDHQLNSGHETQYYYGQPYQEELDRLFGSEAGYKKHYNKTLTIDANGQGSVTYLDQEGRTIATALSGDAPSNLEALTNSSGTALSTASVTTIRAGLLGKTDSTDVDNDQDDNILSPDGRKLSVNTQVIVAGTQTYSFSYNLAGSSYQPSCMPSGFCYQCAYDLTIEVRDQCGVAVGGTPVTQAVGSFNTSCSAGAATFTLSPNPLTISLSTGVYTVSKTLTINQAALDAYTQDYLAQNTCVRTEQSFIDSALAHIDTSGCHIACTNCADADYNSQCEASYQMMLSDVSPNGQYAEYLVANTPAPTQYPLSVLNDAGNQLPMQNANWRHPIINETASHYYEPDGVTISRVPLIQLTSTTYDPPITGTATVTPVNGIPTVEPQDLANLSDFLSNWEPSWATSLVEYHPEYCYYKWCRGDISGQGTGADTLSSDEYDSLLLATTTLTEAHRHHLLDPLGNAVSGTPNQSNCRDPYFRAAGLGSSQYNSVSLPDACEYSKNYQGNSVSIWKLAKVMNSCGTIYGTGTDIDNCLSAALGSLPTNDTLFINNDATWINLRDLYIAIKQHFQQQQADASAMACNGLNTCIGQYNSYNPLAAGMYNGSPMSAWPFFDNYDTLRRQPCGSGYALYGNKIKRFPNENDLAPNMAAAWAGNPNAVINAQNGGYNYYLQTGQCPAALGLQQLLNAINADGKLLASNDSLYHYPAFTSAMYHVMVASSPFRYVKWSGSYSGTTLTGAFGGTGVSCSSMNLVFPTGTFTWSNLGSTFRIESFSQLLATGSFSFTVVAAIDNDMDHSTPPVNVLLTGSSGCLDISCSFSTACNPSVEAGEMVNLFNMLATNGDFYNNTSPGTVLTSGSYGSYFNTTQISNRLGAGTFYWLKTSSTTFEIWNGSGTYPSVLFTLGSLPTGVTLFDGLQINNPSTSAFITAHNPGATTVAFSADWYNTTSGAPHTTKIDLGNCAAPVPTVCVGDEFQRRADLEALLNQLSVDDFLYSSSPTGTALTGYGVFTTLLESPLGVDSYQWTGSYSGLNFTGTVKNNTTALGACAVTMTFVATPPSSYTWADVLRITALTADESNLVNGVAYGFTGVAWFPGNVSVGFTGQSCWSIRNCSMCMANAGNKFQDFEHFNSLTPGYTTTLNYNVLCPASTEYTVTPKASVLCNDTVLYGLDHTQPGTGSYYYTKYRNNGAQTLWSTTTSVTAYTSYTFSAWYMDASNATAAVPVTVELWANGAMLNSVQVTEEAPGLWKKIQGTWNGKTTPGSITIEVKSSGSGSVDTRLGLDDIGFYTQGCEQEPVLTLSPSYPYCDSCRQHMVNVVTANAHNDYEQYIDSVKASFAAAYISHCMGNAVERFNMSFSEKEYHYTLYYYDQGGNLVRTIPPAGVNIVNLATNGTTIKNDRKNSTHTFNTSHTLRTTYTYNTLNQLVKQATPDGDTTRFWYDKLGRIVASQNAKQSIYTTPRYSYTVYDAQGRIAEVGELATGNNLKTASFATQQTYLNDINYPNLLDSAVVSGTNPRFDVTRTYYDATAFASAAARFATGTQDNLRKRVVSAAIYPVYKGVLTSYTSATHYSYDLHGNVKELVQEIPELAQLDDVTNGRYQSFKKMQYFYDLVSGKVNELWYQPGQADAFYHKYEYDADNRVTAAYTSSDYRTWDRDAKYMYYTHGPLARTETGQDKVQGQDYAYTLHGWIKGVNSTALSKLNDMGRDANDDVSSGSTIDQYVPVDQYSYSLSYYDTLTKHDYTSITTNPAFAGQGGSGLTAGSSNLYNGNIRNMVTSIKAFDDATYGNLPIVAKAFRYDQLNRIKQAEAYTNYNSGTNSWNSGGALNDWKEKFSYDENGNILTLVRHGAGSIHTAMDSLNYSYIVGSNQLSRVSDGVSSGNYSDDIDNESANNYIYDSIGNLVKDVSEEIDTIGWNVYGKITKVIRSSSSSKSDLYFEYDAMGNRICKIVKPRGGHGILAQQAWTYTYYLRDAGGNILANYTRDFDTPTTTYNESYTLTEDDLYGSSRVGVRTVSELQVNVRRTYSSTNTDGTYVGTSPTKSSTAAPTNSFVHELKRKAYEMVNHLGNVLVTLSDARTANNLGSTVTGFNAVVITATDYYAFGSPMAKRVKTGTGYRYGFNGKENDPEANSAGEGTQDYGMRIYNPSLGRFLSVDPLTSSYPWYSPYQFAGDAPIWAIDLDGLEPKVTITQKEDINLSDVHSYRDIAYTRVENWNLKWDASKNKYILDVTICSHFIPGFLTNTNPQLTQFLKDNPGIAQQVQAHEKIGHGGQLSDGLNDTKTTYVYQDKTYTGTPDQILTQIRLDHGEKAITQDLAQSVINNATDLTKRIGKPANTAEQNALSVENDANARATKYLQSQVDMLGKHPDTGYDDGTKVLNQSGLLSIFSKNAGPFLEQPTPAGSKVDKDVQVQRQRVKSGTVGGQITIYK